MQSADDPLTEASLRELSGVIWLSYVAATSLVVLIYDSLLTLDDEVRLIFSYFFPPYRLFPDAPCLAWAPFRGKSTLLHQSLPIHCHSSLCKLSSVPHFLSWWTPALKDHQSLLAFTHHSPIRWATFIHPLRPQRY